jgi:hypothetical protein
MTLRLHFCDCGSDIWRGDARQPVDGPWTPGMRVSRKLRPRRE